MRRFFGMFFLLKMETKAAQHVEIIRINYHYLDIHISQTITPVTYISIGPGKAPRQSAQAKSPGNAPRLSIRTQKWRPRGSKFTHVEFRPRQGAQTKRPGIAPRHKDQQNARQKGRTKDKKKARQKGQQNAKHNSTKLISSKISSKFCRNIWWKDVLNCLIEKCK